MFDVFISWNSVGFSNTASLAQYCEQNEHHKAYSETNLLCKVSNQAPKTAAMRLCTATKIWLLICERNANICLNNVIQVEQNGKTLLWETSKPTKFISQATTSFLYIYVTCDCKTYDQLRSYSLTIFHKQRRMLVRAYRAYFEQIYLNGHCVDNHRCS